MFVIVGGFDSTSEGRRQQTLRIMLQIHRTFNFERENVLIELLALLKVESGIFAACFSSAAACGC